MTATILSEYTRIRSEMPTYPAKNALSYARDWQEIKDYERDYVIEVEADWETDRIRGNAIASGDDTYDKKVEDELIARCERGDVWAWCVVTVRVTHAGVTEFDSLGSCSYASLLDFKRGGYYIDMIRTCLQRIEETLESNQEGEH